jgi:hypothetical protein
VVRRGSRGGFVAAHFVNKDPRGHEVLAEVDARITEFTDRIGEAYRAQEAKIDGIAEDVKDAAANAVAAKDAHPAPWTAHDVPRTPTAHRPRRAARTPVLCRGTHR